MGKDGRQLQEEEPLGGVFGPAREAGLVRPVYTYGPKDSPEPGYLWQCPQSAIPDDVWILLMLWWDLRLLRMPPPVFTPLVRLAFTSFEAAYMAVDPQRTQGNMAAAMMAGLLARAT